MRKKLNNKAAPMVERDELSDKLLKENHILIGGCTGSGKSTVLDNLLATICTYKPTEKAFAVIDLKRVSVLRWKYVPHCKGYVTSANEAEKLIADFCDVIENRYKIMEKSRVSKYNGADLYLVIDEAADLLNNPMIPTKMSKRILGMLTHICRVGRACKCHCIYCSQQVARSVIPSSIQANCNVLLGLRCRSKMESRMIIGEPGCETLPRYGQGYLYTPEFTHPELVKIRMISDETIDSLIEYWE